MRPYFKTTNDEMICNLFVLFFICLVLVFETSFLCVVLAVLELVL